MGQPHPLISSCWAFHLLVWLPSAKRLLLWQIDGLTLGKHLPSRKLLWMPWGVYAEVIVDLDLGPDGTATQRTVWTSLFGGTVDDCNSPHLVQRGNFLANLPERLWGPVLRDKAVCDWSKFITDWSRINSRSTPFQAIEGCSGSLSESAGRHPLLLLSLAASGPTKAPSSPLLCSFPACCQ